MERYRRILRKDIDERYKKIFYPRNKVSSVLAFELFDDDYYIISLTDILVFFRGRMFAFLSERGFFVKYATHFPVYEQIYPKTVRCLNLPKCKFEQFGCGYEGQFRAGSFFYTVGTNPS